MNLIRIARTTGLLYLGLAITGFLSVLIRSQLFDAGDPDATLVNVLEHESLARWGIAVELGVVVTQALVAVWFFLLFRSVDAFAAGSLAAFGLVNATVILGSAAFLAAALDVALEDGAAAGDVQLMYVASDNLWGVGAIFFGLWLIPMGRMVIDSRWMPRVLGWILIVGGCGYVLSAFVGSLVPDGQALANALVIPATVGELWMIGYLLVRGVSRRAFDGRDVAQGST